MLVKDKEGLDVTDSDYLSLLLKNPNQNQDLSEFIKEWLYFLYAHGWTYLFPVSKSVGFERKLNGKNEIYNIDPDDIKWHDTSRFWQDKNIKFDYKPLNLYSKTLNNIISYYDVRPNTEKNYIGVSRLGALRQQIENFSLALQGKENLIKRSGSILISLETKTEDMGLDTAFGTGKFKDDGSPITITHKEKLEQQLRETSLGTDSKGVMFSMLPLKSMPLSVGLENINFDKLAIEDARQIYNKFNVPKEFQNLTTEAAKFQNRDLALKEVIQNTIKPLSEKFLSKLIMFYGSSGNTYEIDYSHLPIFSENEGIKITNNQAIVSLYSGLLASGHITESDFNQKLINHGII